jgi:hypothetical protein
VANAGEMDLEQDMFVCVSCTRLLRNPLTALPLIRGHLSILGRGKSGKFDSELNKFMGVVSSWRLNTKN